MDGDGDSNDNNKKPSPAGRKLGTLHSESVPEGRLAGLNRPRIGSSSSSSTTKLRFVPHVPKRATPAPTPTAPNVIVRSEPTRRPEGSRGRGRGRGRGRAEPIMSATGTFGQGPAAAPDGSKRKPAKENVASGSTKPTERYTDSGENGAIAVGDSDSHQEDPLAPVRSKTKKKSVKVKIEEDNNDEAEVETEGTKGKASAKDSSKSVKPTTSKSKSKSKTTKSSRRVNAKPTKTDGEVVVKEEPMSDEEMEVAVEVSESSTIESDDSSDEDESNLLDMLQAESNNEETLMFLQLPPVLPHFKGTAVVPMDVDPSQVEVKVEHKVETEQIDGIKSEETNEISTEYVNTANTSEGRVGKFVFYKSGKMKLQLGNVMFDVTKALSQDLDKQNVVSVDIEQRKMYMMGKLMARLSCTPDLDALLQA